MNFKFKVGPSFSLSPFRSFTILFHYTDLSIRPGEKEVSEGRLTTAKTADFLAAARQRDGKILNALEFPMVLASLNPPPPFSTDLLACRVVDYNGSIGIPTGDIRWGLAATAGAYTWFHLDCMGLGAAFEPQCGKKVLGVINDAQRNFDYVDVFKNFELDEANGCQLEVVLLMPGTRL